MKLPKSFTRVTTFSKYLALSMLIIIPILAFFYGQYYERTANELHSTKKSTAETLVSIYRHGGLCPDGECTNEIFIYKDGSIVEDGKTIKQLPIKQIKQLDQRFTTTNFKHIRAFPFTGTCPTASDGQESVYTFSLPDRQETFASCEYDLSESALFHFIDALLSPEDTFCGGEENINCQTGYVCNFEGNGYLDPGGTCIKRQPRPVAQEGEFCGGQAGIQCESGYYCKMPDNPSSLVSDISGICVKNN